MALTREDLLAIGELMDAKLEPVIGEMAELNGKVTQLDGKVTQLDGKVSELNEKVTRLEVEMTEVKETIEEIREDTAITRAATNSLVQWADEVSVLTRIDFPVKKVAK